MPLLLTTTTVLECTADCTRVMERIAIFLDTVDYEARDDDDAPPGQLSDGGASVVNPCCIC